MNVLTSTDKQDVVELLNSLCVPASLVDVHEGERFVTFAINRQAEQFLGQSNAEVTGKTLAEMHVYPTTQVERSQARFTECVQRGEQVSYLDPAPVDVSGERRWLRATMTPVLDQAGAMVRIMVTFVDVTDVKRAEEALTAALTKVLSGFVTICAGCRRVRPDDKDKSAWVPVEAYLTRRSDLQFTHAMCPTCLSKWYGADRKKG